MVAPLVSFGDVIAALQKGLAARRHGWPEDRFIILSPSIGRIKAHIFLHEGSESFAGWLPVWEEMAASDWIIVPFSRE